MSARGFTRPDLWEKAKRTYGKPITGVFASYEVWRIYDKLLKESEAKDLKKVRKMYKQMQLTKYAKKKRVKK
jgi:hypothetical protein